VASCGDMAPPRPLPDLEPGVRIGRWRLESPLGSGGLSDVWRATTEDASRPVALKILRDPEGSRAHRLRFLREGHLLVRLTHPGLPRCHEVLTEPRPAIALDLLEGATLAERLHAEGPLSAGVAEQLASSVLRTLRYLHQHGVVHRDVKASNIFLADDRRVMLLDLGLAADPGDPLTTTLGDIVGTFAYMAPEQIAGAEVDHRADLYSLGVTLYESLAGERPFRAHGAAGYLEAHRAGASRPLGTVRSDLPRRLIDLVERLMARDPAARPGSAGIARARLIGASYVEHTLRRPPLVGRAAALGALEAALDGGHAVLVTGEIGSGTARLAAWAVQRAREDGFETIAIRCRPQAAPGSPVEQLARDLGRIAGPVRSDPGSLARALENLSAEGRLLLLIEDADHATSDALSLLLASVAAAPRLSVVVTASRDLPDFSGHRVPLRPLTPEETWRILRGMLGTPSPPAGLAQELHHISSGLPAVVVLAIRDLVHRGGLVSDGLTDDGTPRWVLDRSAPLAPSTGLAQLFRHVLASLTNEAQCLLEILSVVGEAIPVSTALELARSPAHALCVHELVQGGLASEERHSDGDWLVLRRPALASMVLERIPIERIRSLHRQLAEALASLPPDPWRDEQVAWHTAHGAGPEDAPRALLALGERLRERGQHARALEVLQKASTAAQSGPETTAAVAIARGEVLEALSRRSEAIDALIAGRRIASGHRLDRLHARALVALAQTRHRSGELHPASELADAALEMLSPFPDDPSLPRALLLAATTHRLQSEVDRARSLYLRCVAAARRQGDEATAAVAEGGLGIILAEEGSLDEALDHLEREVSHLRTQGHAARLVPALYRLAITQRRQGRIDDALAALDEAEDVARFGHLPYERALVDVGRAAIALATCDLEAAEARLGLARVALEPEADAFLRLAYRELQAELRLARGDRQSALAVFQAGEAEARAAGLVATRAYFLGMQGVLTADPDALIDAMDVLGVTGDRRLAARVLLLGARTGDDEDIFEAALEEARNSSDAFLILETLAAWDGPGCADEARAIIDRLMPRLPRRMQRSFGASPPVRWALRDPVALPT